MWKKIVLAVSLFLKTHVQEKEQVTVLSPEEELNCHIAQVKKLIGKYKVDDFQQYMLKQFIEKPDFKDPLLNEASTYIKVLLEQPNSANHSKKLKEMENFVKQGEQGLGYFWINEKTR